MKKTGFAFLCVALLTVLTIAPALADAKIMGKGTCGKCGLGKTASCQNVIKTDDGKLYFVAKNDVSNAFHKHLCQGSKKVSAVGKVEEKDGKLVLHASKIKLAE